MTAYHRSTTRSDVSLPVLHSRPVHSKAAADAAQACRVSPSPDTRSIVTSLNSCNSIWWASCAFSNAAIYLDAVKRTHP